MVTFHTTQEEARADAHERQLREKVLCFVVRRAQDRVELLVFGHSPNEAAGVQVVAGGVEAGETPAQAAVRELQEESGLTLEHPQYLASYLWKAQLPHRFTRQVCHAYTFAAPKNLSTTWDTLAGGQYLFRFRWADLHTFRAGLGDGRGPARTAAAPSGRPTGESA
ncbi:NUDIX domain-containing protein [Deinococcus hopiensis]|uniref:NTP pyrophosphohydrolases containing a Zn-finger, probably nucleic-acid-binding n=1 Tax=Deinococcus hopiensis KR-140 TaxID=695939 RepID=A0A1W1V9D9_9DEIO|nr:NUDIX domain-containing protein [Deinococcus hopiensis]SMB89982.1 NTP pyrophosphohydrolases containing a Zn-finger, probably nucleic-acid-binding [Deinococcus hopiensis KR-140]